jgi:hypothetical protein
MSRFALLNTDVKVLKKDQTSKVWSGEMIRNLLLRNSNAVLKGVVALYKLQTADEKAYKHTNESNGVGFSAYDAPYMTKIAERVISKRGLTKMEVANLRVKLLKYSNQLAKIANKEIKVPA